MFKNKILKPKFWDKSNLSFLSLILLPLTILTFLINILKKFTIKKKFNIKTICVGNIYLGGTGKTPLVIKINEILRNEFRLFVIKKDYSDQIDEQELLKNKTNLIISKSRTKALTKLNKIKNSVAILDDGLQEKSINYTLSIVCFNSSTGIGNAKLLPAGPLRENLSELKNYDAVFINGKKNPNLIKKIKIYNEKIRIFSGQYVLKNKKSLNLKFKYLAFAGIGNPENFFSLLKQNNIKIGKTMIFPDHYNYNSYDINNIIKLAKKNNLKIITSEKDYAKIKKFKKSNINKTVIDLEITEPKNFKNYLINHL